MAHKHNEKRRAESDDLKPMYLKVADRMEQDLPSLERVLPSITALSSRYNTSYFTARRAVEVLKSRKCISAHPEKKMLINVRVRSQSDAPTSAAEELALVFDEEIETGSLRLGEEMEKMEALAAAHHVSKTTVRKACEILMKKGLVHKRGKRYIIGNRPSNWKSHAVRNGGTVAVLIRNAASCSWLLRSYRTSPFLRSFIHGLDRASVRMVQVQYGENPAVVNTEFGRQSFDAFIGRYGTDFLGMLCLVTHRDLPRLDDFLWYWTTFKKPIVWFDYRGDNFKTISTSAVRKRRLYRCRFGESEAVLHALEALCAHGHRTVAFPNCMMQHREWVAHRAAIIEKVIAKHSLPLSVAVFNSPEYLFSSNDPELANKSTTNRKDADIITRIVTQFPHQFHTVMSSSTPVLKAVLTREAFTAILAPNDELAFYYRKWLLFNGINIPKQLSLVSFDDSEEFWHVPLASVDFGLDHMGYASAQILLRGAPVRVSDSGVIVPKCKLHNRGSLGRAPKHPVRV